MAAGHITPVLSQAHTPVDSIQAAQAYYAFAEQRLAYACDGLPEASLAYYGLARTIAVPGMKIANPNGKAALLHRVALAIAPQNMLAANELGVLLAHHGRLEDAERLFQQCVATDPTPENWRNLAVVYAAGETNKPADLLPSRPIRWRRRDNAIPQCAPAISLRPLRRPSRSKGETRVRNPI